MSDNPGTLETVATHLVLAVKPLVDAVSSTENFKAFLYRLGWNAASMPPSYSTLGTRVEEAVQALEALSADPSAQEVLDLLEKAKGVYDAVGAVAEAPPGVDAAGFLEDIGERLFELLLTDYLASSVPQLYNLLRMTNVIVIENTPSTATRKGHVRTRIQWEEIPAILQDPGSLPARVYGWGTPDLKTELILDHLGQLLLAIGFPVGYGLDTDGLGPEYNGSQARDDESTYVLRIPFYYIEIAHQPLEAAVALLGLPGTNGSMPGIIIQPQIPSLFPFTFHLADTIDLRIRAGSNIASLFGILIRPDGISVKYPFQDGASLPQAGFGIGFDFTPAAPALLLGSAGETRVELAKASIDLGVNSSNGALEVIVSAGLDGFALIIAPGEGDGLVSTFLGSREVRVELPVALDWSSVSGLKLRGGGGLEVALHPHLTLGPVSIEELQVRLTGKSAPPAISMDLGASVKLTLGPLILIVQGIGIELTSTFATGGNAGPFDFGAGFKPPNGAGIEVKGGLITGGGTLRLEPDTGEYIGSLELDFQGMFTLNAVGIITTRMPDGSKGFSLLVVITSDFTPIQLSFGFTLNGVGGLLGLNRTAKIDVLRDGIKTNALQSVLFPEDVIANIDRIVSDLKQIFPPMEGRFIFCPMAKIGWGTPSIITLQFGLLLEIPVPRIAVLGVLKALLPEEDAPVLKLQVNFLGVLDIDNRSISFDASLYDSKLLVYTLIGDMAFRLSWGDNPFFLLSVGGFHPAFKDAPGDLQHMTRLTISLLSGDNPRISMESYFAVTSNTVQFGARVELYAAACGFNVYGFAGYDALFQFDPFQFVASLEAGLALRQGTSVLMGIHFSGNLAGPEPWDVKGEASFSILFFDVTIGFHETWGERADQVAPATVDLLALLTGAVNDVRNWQAQIPDQNSLHVSIRKIEPDPAAVIVHPFGVLTFSERLVPLGVTIDKFGDKAPQDAARFDLTEPVSGTSSFSTAVAHEEFARANFFNLKDSDKLSSPSFEMMPSGFSITSSAELHTTSPVSRSVDYEVTYLRKKRFRTVRAGVYSLAKAAFLSARKGSAVSRSGLSFQSTRVSRNAPDAVAVAQERYVIADLGTLQPFSPELTAQSYTEASERYRELMMSRPELRDRVSILAEYELQPE